MFIFEYYNINFFIHPMKTLLGQTGMSFHVIRALNLKALCMSRIIHLLKSFAMRKLKFLFLNSPYPTLTGREGGGGVGTRHAVSAVSDIECITWPTLSKTKLSV